MMTKTLVATVILSTLSLSAFAQSGRSDGLKNELSAEVERLYQQTNSGSSNAPQVQVAALPTKKAAPVVVVNQPQASFVEQRPTTYVDSSPLDESKAARMRRRREAVEAETEMRIVEKLEQDRMDSEKQRASRIFGDKLERQQDRQPAPAPVQPQVILVNPAERELEKEDYKQDIREVVREIKEEENRSKHSYEEEDIDDSSTFLKIASGGNFYRGVDNIKGGYHVTGAFGWDYASGLAVEIGAGLAKFDLYDCGYAGSGCAYSGNVKEIQQVNVNLMTTYRFGNFTRSRITPVIGALSSVVFRDYSGGLSNGDMKSLALDLGVMGGAEIRLSNRLSVTADLSYMMNILKDVDSNSPSSFGFYNNPYSTDVEELNYFNLAIGLKFLF